MHAKSRLVVHYLDKTLIKVIYLHVLDIGRLTQLLILRLELAATLMFVSHCLNSLPPTILVRALYL